MVSLVPAMVGELHTLHALRFCIVGNYGNSVHTGPPVSAHPSNNTVYPEVRMSSPVPDVQPMRFHDAPVLIVTANPPLPEDNTSINTAPVHSLSYILLL
jgi:hypothetical protein